MPLLILGNFRLCCSKTGTQEQIQVLLSATGNMELEPAEPLWANWHAAGNKQAINKLKMETYLSNCPLFGTHTP